MKLMVMDGQGGGIGSTIIKGIRKSVGNDIMILALGTNSIATSGMMKAGANKGGTGENAIIQTCKKVNFIIGPVSILFANSMMGEVTPLMASAVSTSKAKKFLIPLTQEEVCIVGITKEPLPHLVDQVISLIKEEFSNV
ncbi:MAG: hypothetical protein B1H11_10330 [Desulfobacteraceae bacterium 4484_190.1]|nr:MAG: hypothetical protein B1H11_10330 [Desulfobacteraceae bacterium 4484_190.1]